MTAQKVKEIALKILPFVAVLLIGAAIGWGLKPDVVRIEEKIKTVEVEKQVVVIQEQVRVEVVKVKDVQIVERWHREKTEEVKPDGTITRKEVEDRNIDSVLKEKETAVEVRVVEVEKQVVVEKLVDKVVKIEPVLSQWRLGAGGGVNLGISDGFKVNPVVAVTGARRLAGPVWLDLDISVGIDTTAVQPIKNTQGILKFVVEF